MRLTDPGAALLRPPIPPAEASIRFNLSMMGDLWGFLTWSVYAEYPVWRKILGRQVVATGKAFDVECVRVFKLP